MPSPYVFRVIAETILRRDCTHNRHICIAFFGLVPMKIFELWKLVNSEETDPNEKVCPKHLMWSLLFLHTYYTEAILSTMVEVSEKTLRKWIWRTIKKLSGIRGLVRIKSNVIFTVIVSTQ